MIFMPYLLYIIIAVITTIILGAVGIPMAKKYKAHQFAKKDLNLTVVNQGHRQWVVCLWY